MPGEEPPPLAEATGHAKRMCNILRHLIGAARQGERSTAIASHATTLPRRRRRSYNCGGTTLQGGDDRVSFAFYDRSNRL